MRDFMVPSGANYTEFLRDYLVNNNLPDTLSQNDSVFDVDFKALFREHYFMREIGFETEELFKQKLNSKIAIVMPLYKKKFQELQALENNVLNNGYTITQTNNLAHGESVSEDRDATQTNNLASSETINEDKDDTTTNNLTQGVSGSATRDMTNTKNLTETTNDNEADTHVDYKTPVGASGTTLPASSISGGYTDNKSKVNATKANTGTDVIDEDMTNSSTTTNTGTIRVQENNDTTKSGTNTGTIRNVEDNDIIRNTTDTGTITSVYSKSPRFNSIDALKAFKEDFEDVIVECLKAFDDLFMQVF